MLNAADEHKCQEAIACDECMKNAPYHWCCKLECREHEFCKECQWFENQLMLNKNKKG